MCVYLLAALLHEEVAEGSAQLVEHALQVGGGVQELLLLARIGRAAGHHLAQDLRAAGPTTK